MDHVTLTTTLLRVFVLHMLGLDISYWCTKFDHSSFSRSRDMVGAPQNLNGSCHPTIPLLGTVCHPRARTCYYQPAHQN